MNIETQMYRTRYLIDVLPARTLGAHGGELDFVQRDVNMRIDNQHRRITPVRSVRLAVRVLAHLPALAASGYPSGLSANTSAL